MDARRTAVAVTAVLALVGAGLAVRAVVTEPDACERVRAVSDEVGRSERGDGQLSFPESQRMLAEATAACLQQEAEGR